MRREKAKKKKRSMKERKVKRNEKRGCTCPEHTSLIFPGSPSSQDFE
jgi:hypothetical protein